MRSTQALTSVNDFSGFLRRTLGLSHLTAMAYASDVRSFARFLRSEEERTEVNVPGTLAERFVDWLQGSSKNGATTIRRKLVSLRVFFKWLVRNGHAADCPFENTGIVVRIPKRLPRALARADVVQLLKTSRIQQVSGHHSVTDVALRLLVSTGMRIGEMCSIEAADVAPGGTSIRIHGKGDRERIAHIVNPSLQQSIAAMAEDRLAKLGSGAPLFVNRRLSRLTPQAFRLRLHSQAAQSGIRTLVTPHRLRHTAATLLLDEGVDIRFLQRLLGHASIATTEIYTKVVDASLRAALTRVDLLRQM